MSRRILIIVLLLPLFSICQNRVNGKLIDKLSGEPIPYATIGLLKQNAGTNASEEGNFSLTSNFVDTDTLIISAVGYVTLKVPVVKIKSSPLIELEKKILVLKEVLISSKIKWQFAVLNKVDCSNSGIVTSGFTSQIAQKFNSPSINCKLIRIEICTNSPPFFAKQAKFRIRVYDVDSLTEVPYTDLTNEIIEVESHTRVVEIDVEKYNIYIPGKQFFIGIEWIKIPFNEEKKSKFSDVITYRPSISYKSGQGEANEVWMLTYQNSWFPLSNNSRAAISAKVKF